MRARSIIDCIAAVDAREADAFVALEPEARFVLDKLKLSESIKMVAAPAGVFNVVAALPKDAPRTKELLPLINKAIVDYKATGGYASTIVAHLAELAGMPAPTQR
jgi:ABC-type amino acid transport substrate-binding protein